MRPFAPKLFLTDRKEKDPVAVYKLLLRKDRRKMKGPDGPFYIAVNNVGMKSKSSDKCWFKCNAVGINKLGSERNQCQGKRVLGTINSAIYSHLSTKQQMHKSNLLANISSECTSITLFSPTATPSTSAELRQEGACHYSNPAQRSLALSRVKSFVEKSSQ